LVWNFGQFFTLHCYSSLSCVSDYLAITSGGYLYMNSLCKIIAAWLDASRRSQDGVQLTRSASLSAREESVEHLKQSWGMDIALYKNLPFIFVCCHTQCVLSQLVFVRTNTKSHIYSNFSYSLFALTWLNNWY